MDDDVADLLAYLRATWLARGDDIFAVLLQLCREERNLRGFSTSFRTFKRDHAACGLFFKRHRMSLVGLFPVGEEGFQIVSGRAFTGAHIMATGADANTETGFGIEAH